MLIYYENALILRIIGLFYLLLRILRCFNDSRCSESLCSYLKELCRIIKAADTARCFDLYALSDVLHHELHIFKCRSASAETCRGLDIVSSCKCDDLAHFFLFFMAAV